MNQPEKQNENLLTAPTTQSEANEMKDLKVESIVQVLLSLIEGLPEQSQKELRSWLEGMLAFIGELQKELLLRTGKLLAEAQKKHKESEQNLAALIETQNQVDATYENKNQELAAFKNEAMEKCENGLEFLRNLSELMTKHGIRRVELGGSFNPQSICFVIGLDDDCIYIKHGDTPEKMMADYNYEVKLFDERTK